MRFLEVGCAAKEGDQKVFCSPSFGLPNPRRLTSATPIRGISRLRRGPFGTFESGPFGFIEQLNGGDCLKSV